MENKIIEGVKLPHLFDSTTRNPENNEIIQRIEIYGTTPIEDLIWDLQDIIDHLIEEDEDR